MRGWARFLNLAKRFWRYFNFSAQKNGFFQTRLKRELTLLKWQQKEDFFAIFYKKTLITSSKTTQILKIRAYLMQNVIKIDIKKVSDPKALTFGVQDLKTSLGQFGPKYFSKRLIRPLVQNSSSNFQKNRTSFSQESKNGSNKIMKS